MKKTDSKSSLTSETSKMNATKKMSIFVLQPNALHAQWQGEKLNSVFQLLESSNFQPHMINEETMINMKDLKGKMFVIEPFSGQLFQYLKNNKAWVLGPQLITTCVDHNITIPCSSYPLYSLAMQSLTICCTNISHADREKIRRSVAYMGGKFQTNLNANVTHLVCGACAASEKYFVAVENGIQVMMPEWIQNVLVLSGQKTVKGTDSTFDRFKCPLFYKFTISLSGFVERDRNTIKQYVEREGATYSPSLIKDKCTHLICKEPKGSKFEHAVKWRIPTLKPEWIFESSEKGSCLRLTNFLWPAPNINSNSSKENEKPLINDTVDSSSKIVTVDQRHKSTSLLTVEEMNDLEERFDKWMNNRSKKFADDLFDGLKVFLGQFSSTLRMRMQKILDGGCAVRFDAINPSVTHIIRGNEPISNLTQISVIAPNAHIVNPQWLLDCCEKNELVSENDYLCSSDRDEKQDSNPNLTDDKRKSSNSNLSMLSSASLTRQQTSSFNVDQTVLQDDTPRLRRTPGSGTSTPSIITEYALSPFSLLKRYSNVPRPPVFEQTLTDTQIDKISAQLPPTESQINVDRLMSDIDILMPTLLNHRKSSSSLSLNTVSTASSSRINMMSSRSFFLAQQAKLTIDEDSSSEVKVSWIDDSTEAERIRQHQLHNLDEMTQSDDIY
ncbi:unnamed protein product [Rotaria sp. Silwood2]|nr:unnamed protein product [Rotaria sp. Silwood2]CAF2655884.1 unnamed protein product [Rotaria sp. Silwood2]CAF3858003.1 unnamed protein product [Rotaria sp. Silwood2]CAF3885103.1 unnamed protein product [Rotaria sp. Silwood2]CAF3953109.1 unnamed protein product [Rotaria sp. Silwood2]